VTDVDTRDVSAGVGVEIVYDLLRSFNRTFHNQQIPEFADAEEWEQAAATSSFIYVRDHPELSPPEIHREWLGIMRDQGWEYGEKMDPEARTHPHMRVWEDLPPWARRMLYITVTVVHILAFPIEQVDEVMADDN
jgi:hypothetical protein